MNTQDITQSGFKGKELTLSGDKLDQIFQGQKSLMEDYIPIAEAHYSKIFGDLVKLPPGIFDAGNSNIQTKAGNFLIKDMLDACIHEISESVQTLKNWKAWKQTEVPADSDHFKEEMIDALHFYIEACIISGITPDEMYDLYFKKHKVNQFRQESKY